MAENILSLEKVTVERDGNPIVNDISLDVNEGELIVVVGRNGAGKTTLMEALGGVLHVADGQVLFRGENITNEGPDSLVEKGLVLVPQGKEVFPDLTVKENLILSSFKARGRMEENLEWVYDLFPRLKERETQKAGTLSGGERGMLCLGTGLMADPEILLLDEPTEGIQPNLVTKIFDTLEMIKEEGKPILLVEQKVEALNICDRSYFIQQGRITESGAPDELEEEVTEAYFGVR